MYSYNNNNNVLINRSSRRKRGMASNPLFIIPDFFCIFPINFAMATLGLKEMRKFFGNVGKKVCPVGCLSLVLLNWANIFPYLPKGIFPFPSNLRWLFFLHFPKELCCGYLRFEGNEKIPLGR